MNGISGDLVVAEGITIPEADLDWTVSRSGGPGGQHVNKVSTRVTLYLDLDGTAALTDLQKARIRERLSGRVGADGRLRVSCGRNRSQAANRREARERLASLLARALEQDEPRRRTRVPAAARKKRLEDKKRRAEVKRGRSRVRRDD